MCNEMGAAVQQSIANSSAAGSQCRSFDQQCPYRTQPSAAQTSFIAVQVALTDEQHPSNCTPDQCHAPALTHRNVQTHHHTKMPQAVYLPYPHLPAMQ
jgi:hypothetical protein